VTLAILGRASLVRLIRLRPVPNSAGDEVEFRFTQSFDCALDGHRFLLLFGRDFLSAGLVGPVGTQFKGCYLRNSLPRLAEMHDQLDRIEGIEPRKHILSELNER